MMESRIKRLAYDAVLLAIALIFSYVEFLFPALSPIPGFTLGLANLLILFVAKGISFYDAAVVSLLRVFCTALLFGTVTSFWFSFLGAVVVVVPPFSPSASKTIPHANISSSKSGIANFRKFIFILISI